MNLPSVLFGDRRHGGAERPRAALNGDPPQVPTGEGIWAPGQCETLELKQELDNNSSLKPAEGTMRRGQKAGVYEL